MLQILWSATLGQRVTAECIACWALGQHQVLLNSGPIQFFLWGLGSVDVVAKRAPHQHHWSTEIHHRFLEAFPPFLSEEPSPSMWKSKWRSFSRFFFPQFSPSHAGTQGILSGDVKKFRNASVLIFGPVFTALQWLRPISRLKLKFRKRAASPRKWVTLPEQNIHDIPNNCEPSEVSYIVGKMFLIYHEKQFLY